MMLKIISGLTVAANKEEIWLDYFKGPEGPYDAFNASDFPAVIKQLHSFMYKTWTDDAVSVSINQSIEAAACPLTDSDEIKSIFKKALCYFSENELGLDYFGDRVLGARYNHILKLESRLIAAAKLPISEMESYDKDLLVVLNRGELTKAFWEDLSAGVEGYNRQCGEQDVQQKEHVVCLAHFGYYDSKHSLKTLVQSVVVEEAMIKSYEYAKTTYSHVNLAADESGRNIVYSRVEWYISGAVPFSFQSLSKKLETAIENLNTEDENDAKILAEVDDLYDEFGIYTFPSDIAFYRYFVGGSYGSVLAGKLYPASLIEQLLEKSVKVFPEPDPKVKNSQSSSKPIASTFIQLLHQRYIDNKSDAKRLGGLFRAGMTKEIQSALLRYFDNLEPDSSERKNFLYFLRDMYKDSIIDSFSLIGDLNLNPNDLKGFKTRLSVLIECGFITSVSLPALMKGDLVHTIGVSNYMSFAFGCIDIIAQDDEQLENDLRQILNETLTSNDLVRWCSLSNAEIRLTYLAEKEYVAEAVVESLVGSEVFKMQEYYFRIEIYLQLLSQNYSVEIKEHLLEQFRKEIPLSTIENWVNQKTDLAFGRRERLIELRVYASRAIISDLDRTSTSNQTALVQCLLVCRNKANKMEAADSVLNMLSKKVCLAYISSIPSLDPPVSKTDIKNANFILDLKGISSEEIKREFIHASPDGKFAWLSILLKEVHKETPRIGQSELPYYFSHTTGLTEAQWLVLCKNRPEFIDTYSLCAEDLGALTARVYSLLRSELEQKSISSLVSFFKQCSDKIISGLNRTLIERQSSCRVQDTRLNIITSFKQSRGRSFHINSQGFHIERRCIDLAISAQLIGFTVLTYTNLISGTINAATLAARLCAGCILLETVQLNSTFDTIYLMWQAIFYGILVAIDRATEYDDYSPYPVVDPLVFLRGMGALLTVMIVARTRYYNIDKKLYNVMLNIYILLLLAIPETTKVNRVDDELSFHAINMGVESDDEELLILRRRGDVVRGTD